MTERELSRAAARGWAIIRHAEEVTGNVARTCRYFGISRQQYYTWLRRYEEQGIDGLRPRSRRPHASPNATSSEVIGKIVYLCKTYHFGPRKISMGNDTLADIEGAHGSRNGDTLTGDTGDNVFALEGGDDAVNAAGGADLIFYPEPPLEAEGVNVDLTVGTAMGAGSDSLTGFESVWGTPENDTLRGDGANNELRGRLGDDLISGEAGDDVLNAGRGTDSLDGGAGTDSCVKGETVTHCELS